MSNSKNIMIFPDWFGIDNKSVKRHKECCEFLYNKIGDDSKNQIQWGSDKTGFWLEEKSSYYQHACENGKVFNFPFELKEMLDLKSLEFSFGNLRVIKIDKKFIGKIHGSEAQRTYSGELDPHYLEQARQELQENPIPEAGFDWNVVKTAMEE